MFIIYTYAGYPLLIFIWAVFFPKKTAKVHNTCEPAISIVIAAHNEEHNIKKRMANLMAQDYPHDKMEIILVSDGSTDNTCRVIEKIIKENNAVSGNRYDIKLIRLNENMGKAVALNTGVESAEGEFVIFTDARQEFEYDALRELVANFNDPFVGCVSGELVFYKDGENRVPTEMGFYWNLEKMIRKMESRTGSVPGATGAIYAIRRSLFVPIPKDTLLDDVFVPMMVVFKGYRTIFDPDAVAWDIPSKHVSQEKARKIRTLVGNYQLLELVPDLLIPNENPIFFRYFSHKICRLFVPFAFILFLLSSFMLTGFYKLFFAATVFLMLLPVMEKKISQWPVMLILCKLSRTFISLNYFAFVAFFRYMSPGKKHW